MLTFAATLPHNTSSLHVRTSTIVKSASYPLQVQSGMVYHSKSQLSPLTTISGEGGVARLNVLTIAKELAWNVQPYGMIGEWNFTGTISYQVLDPFTHTYVPNGSVKVSTSGLPGGSNGGNVGIGGFAKGLNYIATLNGKATDIIGDTDTVLPGCSVAWYFSK